MVPLTEVCSNSRTSDISPTCDAHSKSGEDISLKAQSRTKGQGTQRRETAAAAARCTLYYPLPGIRTVSMSNLHKQV